MDKNNKNNIVIATFFIIYIFATMFFTIKENYTKIKETSKTVIYNPDKLKYKDRVDLFKSSNESVFANNLVLKYDYIDTYGLFQKVLFKRVVSDAGAGKDVIKLSNGNLSFAYPDTDEMYWVDKLSIVNEYTKEKGIYMAFAIAPWSISEEAKLPFYVKDNLGEVRSRFVINSLDKGINIIDLQSELTTDPSNWFFRTDHHWTIDTAFESYKIIANHLDKELDLNITDKYYNDFNRTMYPNAFLGSYGKRVGKYYAKLDDFEYIYPNFDTNFDVVNSEWDVMTSHYVGDFRHSIAHEEYLTMGIDDARETSIYYTYTNGGRALVQINNLDPINNKKILILKDSYGEPVFAFLSLVFKEVRAVDVRCWANINLKKYIDDYNPDAVLFLHTPSSLYDKKLINFKWE